MLPMMLSNVNLLHSPPQALFAHPLDMLGVVHSSPGAWAYSDFHVERPSHRLAMKRAWRQQQDMMSEWRRLLTDKIPARSKWELNADDEAEIAFRLPELAGVDDDSVSARLSDDGRTLSLLGSVSACDCKEITLAQITLPHGPASAEDVKLTLQGDDLVTVRASKPRPRATELKVLREPPPAQAQATEQAPANAFNEGQLEKELERKFNIAPGRVSTEIVAVAEKMGDADLHSSAGKVREEKPDSAPSEPLAEKPKSATSQADGELASA